MQGDTTNAESGTENTESGVEGVDLFPISIQEENAGRKVVPVLLKSGRICDLSLFFPSAQRSTELSIQFWADKKPNVDDLVAAVIRPESGLPQSGLAAVSPQDIPKIQNWAFVLVFGVDLKKKVGRLAQLLLQRQQQSSVSRVSSATSSAASAPATPPETSSPGAGPSCDAAPALPKS